MMKRNFCLFFLILLLSSKESISQSVQPFAEEIETFRKADSIAFPPAGSILLVGSSSFTMWKDVDAYFPGRTILNRAFGGSTLEDLIRYRYDVLYPYQPKQIVMYCGENDFAASDTVSVITVVHRFEMLFQFIRARYPSVPFVYVSMKPSPSRKHLMHHFAEANRLIQQYLKQFRRTAFADVYHAMLEPDGAPKAGLFLEDQLHMNAKGYAIWKQVLDKYLIKN
jgi:lysophospholipase L1-like esterase